MHNKYCDNLSFDRGWKLANRLCRTFCLKNECDQGNTDYYRTHTIMGWLQKVNYIKDYFYG